MHAALATYEGKEAERNRTILTFALRLLDKPDSAQGSLEDLLAEVAEVFGADRAGLTSLGNGQLLACSRPALDPTRAEEHAASNWLEADLLLRVQQEPRAICTERDGGGSYLLTRMGSRAERYALWLEDRQRDGWSDACATSLTLLSHLLADAVEAPHTPRWADQLERAIRQERLEDAAAVARRLAHDFGNFLTGILGFSELALTQQANARTPLHSYLSEVYRSAENGARYTHRLHLFSRRQKPSGRSCSLPEVLDQEIQEQQKQNATIQFYTRVPADTPPLALDSGYLRLILGALLENAREAMTGPGSITVSARVLKLTAADALDLFGNLRPGPYVEICVADTGTGLSPEAQRLLFATPFYSTKPRHRGIGLATAYGILHVHYGGLRLYPGTDHGAVARVLIPLASPSQGLAEPRERRENHE
jgi:signal transduction histidine kinase